MTQNLVHDNLPSQDATTHQIWDSYPNNMRDATDKNILKTRSDVKVTVTWNGMQHSSIPRCIHIPNLGFPSQIIQEICFGHGNSKNKSFYNYIPCINGKLTRISSLSHIVAISITFMNHSRDGVFRRKHASPIHAFHSYMSPWWPWKLDQCHKNVFTKEPPPPPPPPPRPNDIPVTVWSSSGHWFRR